MSAGTGSLVWNFFTESPGAGICRLCLKTIETSGNTTNLRNHITKVHKINLTEVSENESDFASKLVECRRLKAKVAILD